MSDRDPTEMDPAERPEEIVAMLAAIRRGYHEPGETPREEMWEAIAARIRAEQATVVPLRRRAAALWSAPWMRLAVAASLVLLLGVAVGRVTAPGAPPTEASPTAAGAVDGGPGSTPARGLDPALRGYLGRSESLLSVVRSDGRQGRIDPTASAWARSLLAQTRMLLDARVAGDPAVVALLQDMELVLAQIVMATEAGPLDGPRARAELDLMLAGMDAGEVLPRIQAACSRGCVRPEV